MWSRTGELQNSKMFRDVGRGAWGVGDRVPPPPPSPAPCPLRGLTLVELVLATAMFSFLMGAVGGLVLTSGRVQRMWGSVIAPYQSADRAITRLAMDLQAARPLFHVPFRGNVDGLGLEFARLGPVDDGEGTTTAWFRVVYRLEHAGEDITLVREEFPWRSGAGEDTPLRHEVLARLGSGQWTFGKNKADKELTWTPSWDGTTEGVPQLVKFDCTVPVAQGRAPLTLSRVIRNPAGNLPEVKPQ